jgi:hypothetical protein
VLGSRGAFLVVFSQKIAGRNCRKRRLALAFGGFARGFFGIFGVEKLIKKFGFGSGWWGGLVKSY